MRAAPADPVVASPIGLDCPVQGATKLDSALPGSSNARCSSYGRWNSGVEERRVGRRRDGSGRSRTSQDQTRVRSASSPSPERSSSPAGRPLIARMIEASGPVTSGPVPANHATFEARSVSPVLRRLPPRIGLVFRAISATVTRLRGGTSTRRPSGRAMSSP